MPPEAGRLAIETASASLGLGMDDRQIDQLLAFLALLGKWNRVYNLTAVRDPAEMVSQHVVDSLAALPALARHLGSLPGRVMDVGSGAGVPGLVWAIARAGLAVHCVDAVGKKASFIQQAAAELGLDTVRAVHGRVESLPPGGHDVVASRAFASLPDFTRWTRHHLAPGGVWLAMKGKRPSDELAALDAGVSVFHVEPLQVPGLAAERCLVWMRPAAAER